MADEEQKAGWRWLLEKRRWLWLLVAICTLAAAGGTAWWIGWRWLMVLALSAGLLVTFHPLDCWVKWRLSWRGQRGEAWFRYLFGALGIGVSGSPAGARVLVSIGPWRRVVFNTRSKVAPEPVVPPPAEPPRPPAAPIAIKPVLTPTIESQPEVKASSEPMPTVPTPQPAPQPASPPVAPPAPKPESEPATVPIVAHDATTTTVATTGVQSAEPSRTTEPSSPPPSGPATLDFDQDIGRLSPPPQAPHPKREDTSEAEPSGPSLRERLRSLRRRFRSTWQKIRKWYRIARDIWKRATEPCRRLLWNLWECFSFLGPRAHLRYGLAEPHIVGMIQGLLAPLAGILIPFGALIRVEPVFAGPTIWCRGETGVRIHPWRLVWTLARLVTEPELLRGVRDAWRAWRSGKASAAAEKNEPA